MRQTKFLLPMSFSSDANTHINVSCMISDCRKDILIMWDNSQSIGIKHYRVIKKFLKQLIQVLNVGRDGTHLGFLTFSSQGKTRKLLDVGQIQDPIQLSNKLDEYNYEWDLMGDKTYTGEAFKIANEVSVNLLQKHIY